jgi:hypothetical protein
MGMKNQEAVLGCRKTFDLTPSEFLFLWYLAFKGNDEDRDIAVRGEAWPGHLTIKAEIGLDPDTARKAAKRLSALDVLTIHETGYKDRASKTYVVDYVRIAEYLGDAVGESPTPGASITDPQSADYAPPVGDLPTQGRRSTHRTGIQQEQKKNVNGNEQKQRSSVSPFVSTPETSGETPEPPDERFEWAKKHKFWSKFTTNPKSFKTGCLDSEEFNQQFAERKKKSAKSSNGSDLHKAAYGIPRNEEEARHLVDSINSRKCYKCFTVGDEPLSGGVCKKCETARICLHCKVVQPQDLRHGYCGDCIHHHPDRELHWYDCSCERCVAYRAKKKSQSSIPVLR